MHRAHNKKDGYVVDRELLIARGKATPALETIDATFKDIPTAFSIEFHDSSAIST
jgi:hypothetical protein